MHPCTYATEKGGYAADCGTLVVPENRHDAHSRLIALPVKRIKALSAHPREPVFRLQGGPGLTNMDFPDASRFAGDRDVVLVGYRGVDGSSVLQCPEAVSAMKHARDFLGTAFYRRLREGPSDCAAPPAGGRRRSRRLLAAGAGRRPRGRAPRARLPADRPAQRERGHAHGADLRVALPEEHPPLRADRRQPARQLPLVPATNDAQIRKYAALCAQRRVVQLADERPRRHARLDPEEIAGRWGFLRIKPGNAEVGAFFGLMHSTGAASPISSPMTIDSWLAAEDGDASGLWLLSTLAQVAFPDVQVKGDSAAVARTDAAYARRYFAAPRGRALGDRQPRHRLPLGRRPPAGRLAGEPGREPLRPGADSKVETLVINGDLDFATPPQQAHRELMPYLPNGHEVVLPGLGHTDDFWDYQPRAAPTSSTPT